MTNRLHVACGDQRGITGLETAIVLIAFVVVASVFAFTILNSGLLATEQTRETVIGGLEEASGSLVIRGSMVAIAVTTSTPASVETVSFQMTTALTSDAAVDLSASSTIITYIDSDQSENLTFVSDPDTNAGWGTTWLVGNGGVLNQGERVEMTVNLTGLAPLLEAR